MATTVKTGWLHDSNGNKFAPKTLLSQVQTNNGEALEDVFQAAIDNLSDNKVDKVDGKGLSTNDFTTDYKNKVDSALQSFTETDPTVPAWAKAETKPEYTAEEVGLGNVDNTSDMDKPVSTLTQVALDGLRAELSDVIVNESGEWKVVDGEGNIIFRVAADGAHTTDLILNGNSVTQIIFAHTEDENVHVSTAEKEDWNNKVDKVEGKGLSMNDFTDEDKEKVDAALPKSGGTMTGTLTLSSDPTANLHAATKQYVDNLIGDIDAAVAQLDAVLGGD